MTKMQLNDLLDKCRCAICVNNVNTQSVKLHSYYNEPRGGTCGRMPLLPFYCNLGRRNGEIIFISYIFNIGGVLIRVRRK